MAVRPQCGRSPIRVREGRHRPGRRSPHAGLGTEPVRQRLERAYWGTTPRLARPAEEDQLPQRQHHDGAARAGARQASREIVIAQRETSQSGSACSRNRARQGGAGGRRTSGRRDRPPHHIPSTALGMPRASPVATSPAASHKSRDETEIPPPAPGGAKRLSRPNPGMSVRRTVDLEDGDHAVACDSATISSEATGSQGSTSWPIPRCRCRRSWPGCSTRRSDSSRPCFGTVIAALALGVGLQARRTAPSATSNAGATRARV